MTLNDLKEGQQAMILKIRGRGTFRHRIIELGFVRGQMVSVLRSAPLKDPVVFRILDSEVSLRRAEAMQIEVLACTPEEAQEYAALQPFHRQEQDGCHGNPQENPLEKKLDSHSVIEVCMVGNPNTGKTSLYNALSGSFEHVGNYSGVTVDAKTAEFVYKGHRIRLTDLPGTYSFSPYSPEERVVMEQLLERRPDVIVNVVDASNLERNLYMTTQLIDMDYRVVMALNMYDELESSGASLQYDYLGKLLGMPVVPTVGRTQTGTEALLDKLIDVNEDRDETVRHTHIPYAEEMENSLRDLQASIWQDPWYDNIYSSRYLAIKFLEGDTEWLDKAKVLEYSDEMKRMAEAERNRLQKIYGEDIDQVFADYRYAFVRGALKECYRPARSQKNEAKAVTSSRGRITERLDNILTHRIWGFPIFLAFLWIMFQATFTIGQYPMDWIEAGVDALAGWLNGLMPDNILRAVLVDGIIQGVGGVIVFLPNILILFLFISLMEATGYMARVAFIMDMLMHTIGLHGKSFIPLIIGFGCNVPAIMATRTIENRKDRLITMLILPFMSCSARLPVYVLLVGMFFGAQAGTVIFFIYLFGILISILSALLFRHTILKAFDSPFVMEMPPYRLPTWRSVWQSLGTRTMQYLKKMGGVILIASVIVWALGYFPVSPETSVPDTVQMAELPPPDAEKLHMENSYLGRIGKFIEPAIKPLGMNWQMGICLLAGVSAKEVVVSTMSVIMNPEETFTPLTALSFIAFVLLYFPCVAVFSAIGRESGSWKWAVFTAVYTTAVAWVVSFLVFRIGGLFL
ncbi:MAG: ferrous iron transport protein B [Bacteroides sp.]|nr:ferrous iron transport protein B [Bacteroides sp.]